MRRVIHYLCLLAVLCANCLGPGLPASAQGGTIATIMNNMTPAEKVGQLFVVTYYGNNLQPNSDIYNLITQYHIGGVMLAAGRDNLTATVNAPAEVLTLTNQLQALAALAAQTPRDIALAPGSEASLPPYLPLFIAINQDDYNRLIPGLTPLPALMALGAAWNLQHATSLGEITGRELEAVGINLLLGPALDVLDNPRPQGPGDLGTRVFGGDPAWVGVMGQAFIQGVHTGSNNRLAVIAKHFPGYGSADRDPTEEVPTISKSLEQLNLNELYPFFTVTGRAADASAAADGLLSAHIRFRGFQGDLRQSTNPVSFDPQALNQLLALPDLKSWRDNGGLLMSDSLGVPAIKQLPAYIPFNGKRIAREAFLAGNDVLYLDEFGQNPRTDQTATIIETLTYFTQQYQSDANFAARVDAAVERILRLKLRMFGQFDPARAQRPEAGLSAVGQGGPQVSALAQDAITLVFPSQEEVNARIPQPPGANDRIVIFTDTRLDARACTDCPAAPLLEERQLERLIVQQYGPEGSGQIRAGNVQSFSLEELLQYLNTPASNATPEAEPPAVQSALEQADWLIFNLLPPNADLPSSTVLARFLTEQAATVRETRVLVFAYSAPYYLDATDLSKLTAFYALYSEAAPFVEVAARLLFRDVLPHGNPPVSVQSLSYNLIEVIAPDPNQLIDIVADKVEVSLGDTLQLSTSVIIDHNGHTVPDGTRVSFRVQYQEDELPALLPDVPTHNGVATVSVTLNRTGRALISVVSEPAFSSLQLQIDVQQGTPSGIVTIIPPTDTPAPTATPSPTHTPTPSETPAPTVTPAPTEIPLEPTPNRVLDRDFFLMCIELVIAFVVGYQLGTRHNAPASRGTRVGLAGVLGVLVSYNYFALGGPGTDWALAQFGVWAAATWGLLGAALGLAVGWYRFVRPITGTS